jgi:hypothetical protein
MPLAGSGTRTLLRPRLLLGNRLVKAREHPAGFGLELAYQGEVTFGVPL